MKNNKSPKTTKKEQTEVEDEYYPHCLHESAHAVIGWYHGAIIKSLTIVGPVKDHDPDRPRSSLYCVVQHRSMLSLEEINFEDVMLRVNVSLAPQAIQDKIKSNPSIGSLHDTAEAMRFLTWGIGNPKIRPIIESAQRAVDENSDDWRAASLQFFEENSGPVRDLLDRAPIMSAIEKLAIRLLKGGRMSGYETVRFLEKIWIGPLPEKAKAANQHPVHFKGESAENTLAAAERLTRMAFEIIEECRPETKVGEQLLEKASLSVLASVFKLNELLRYNID